MRPDLKTVTGDLLGKVTFNNTKCNKFYLLTALGSNLKFIDANKINLNNLKAAIFKDGMVSVKPLTSIIKISKRLSRGNMVLTKA
jgi:hypothetical protein